MLPALLDALSNHGHQDALHWQGQTISRAVLWHKILLLGQALAQAGITHQSVVAVLLPRCPDVLVVLLALWLRGAVYVPLDTTWPRERLESALELCGAKLLLTTQDLQHLCARSACACQLLAPMDFTAAPPDAAPWHDQPWLLRTTADDIAYLLFTSGTSGNPKAVQVSHASLASVFAAVLPLLQLRPGWRLLGCSALCFDIVLFEWLAPLLCNCSLVLADETSHRDPAALQQLIRTQSVDVVQATPSLWQMLLREPPLPAGQLKLLISTGEALDLRTALGLLALNAIVWNLYGPTECTIWSSAWRVSAADAAHCESPVPIGQPLQGCCFTLLPQSRAETMTGKETTAAETNNAADTGELLISGAGVATGYLGADATQNARFACTAEGRRSFRSGDLCRRDAAGNYHWLRRCDTQLKINGYRIEAGEIETQLRRHPSIRDAVCLARDLDGGAQLLAFVLCEPGTPNKDKARWNAQLASWLPEWMLPQRYFVLEAWPLDTNGKLDRKALLQLGTGGNSLQPEATDALQAETSAIFCSVLELDAIGPCDSFFDFGGNSMLSATLLLAINQRFGTQLSLRQILRSPPTVQGITTLLRQAGAAAATKT